MLNKYRLEKAVAYYSKSIVLPKFVWFIIQWDIGLVAKANLSIKIALAKSLILKLMLLSQMKKLFKINITYLIKRNDAVGIGH